MAKQMEIPRIAVVENMSALSCPHCGHDLPLFGHPGLTEQEDVPEDELPLLDEEGLGEEFVRADGAVRVDDDAHAPVVGPLEGRAHGPGEDDIGILYVEGVLSRVDQLDQGVRAAIVGSVHAVLVKKPGRVGSPSTSQGEALVGGKDKTIGEIESFPSPSLTIWRYLSIVSAWG